MVKGEEEWAEINKHQGLVEIAFAPNAVNEFRINREFLAMK
jgi:hypothetical protein